MIMICGALKGQSDSMIEMPEKYLDACKMGCKKLRTRETGICCIANQQGRT